MDCFVRKQLSHFQSFQLSQFHLIAVQQQQQQQQQHQQQVHNLV